MKVGTKVKFSDPRIKYYKEDPNLIGTVTQVIKASYEYDPPSLDLIWVRWANGTHLVHRRISLSEV